MSNKKQLLELITIAHDGNMIDDEEFVLLYDLNRHRSLQLPYWKYQSFDLDSMENDECVSEFRFEKNDIYTLADVLQLPNRITCYNGTVVHPVEALCIFLKRFAYPCRYLDMIHRFARPVPELCIISNYMINFIYDHWKHLLKSMNQPWLSPDNLQNFADAIHQKGGALSNCWAFVDGTVRPICRPQNNQRVVYNGHKKVHALKFQAVGAPKGMIANLYGPVDGRRHDSGMLTDSNLLNELQIHSYGPTGNMLCIYGDPAYPLRPQLQAPFKGAVITPLEEEWNKSMSAVRINVEWLFGNIVNYFKFIDFKKGLKIELSAVGKMYICCALMQNARVCLYGSESNSFFDIDPVTLQDYFL